MTLSRPSNLSRASANQNRSFGMSCWLDSEEAHDIYGRPFKRRRCVYNMHHWPISTYQRKLCDAQRNKWESLCLYSSGLRRLRNNAACELSKSCQISFGKSLSLYVW